MKNKFFITALLALFVTLFTACGSDSGNTSPIIVDNSIVLSQNESVICSDDTDFTVTPSPEEPDVTFIQDAKSGDTTIYVDTNSLGSVTVTGCTKK